MYILAIFTQLAIPSYALILSIYPKSPTRWSSDILCQFLFLWVSNSPDYLSSLIVQDIPDTIYRILTLSLFLFPFSLKRVRCLRSPFMELSASFCRTPFLLTPVFCPFVRWLSSIHCRILRGWMINNRSENFSLFLMKNRLYLSIWLTFGKYLLLFQCVFGWRCRILHPLFKILSKFLNFCTCLFLTAPIYRLFLLLATVYSNFIDSRWPFLSSPIHLLTFFACVSLTFYFLTELFQWFSNGTYESSSLLFWRIKDLFKIRISLHINSVIFIYVSFFISVLKLFHFMGLKLYSYGHSLWEVFDCFVQT